MMHNVQLRRPVSGKVFKTTLAELLEYWQRGLLSDEEMLRCWHDCRLDDEQMLQQLIDMAIVPSKAEWWGVHDYSADVSWQRASDRAATNTLRQ